MNFSFSTIIIVLALAMSNLVIALTHSPESNKIESEQITNNVKPKPFDLDDAEWYQTCS